MAAMKKSFKLQITTVKLILSLIIAVMKMITITLAIYKAMKQLL